MELAVITINALVINELMATLPGGALIAQRGHAQRIKIVIKFS